MIITQHSTLYATQSDVDQYAKKHGKQFWEIIEQPTKLDYIERASNKIHIFHNQGVLWMHSKLQFACILQAIHFAKFAISADIGQHARNTGGFSDGITSGSGGSETWDELSLQMLNDVMDKAGILQGQWGKG